MLCVDCFVHLEGDVSLNKKNNNKTKNKIEDSKCCKQQTNKQKLSSKSLKYDKKTKRDIEAFFF